MGLSEKYLHLIFCRHFIYLQKTCKIYANENFSFEIKTEEKQIGRFPPSQKQKEKHNAGAKFWKHKLSFLKMVRTTPI